MIFGRKSGRGTAPIGPRPAPPATLKAARAPSALTRARERPGPLHAALAQRSNTASCVRVARAPIAGVARPRPVQSRRAARGAPRARGRGAARCSPHPHAHPLPLRRRCALPTSLAVGGTAGTAPAHGGARVETAGPSCRRGAAAAWAATGVRSPCRRRGRRGGGPPRSDIALEASPRPVRGMGSVRAAKVAATLCRGQSHVAAPPITLPPALRCVTRPPGPSGRPWGIH